VATFEGKTNVIQHKGVATRLAHSSGAVAVANHIEINEAAREKAAENLESGRRRAQIKRGEARSETATAPQSR
jgi:precorrin isomerase